MVSLHYVSLRFLLLVLYSISLFTSSRSNEPSPLEVSEIISNDDFVRNWKKINARAEQYKPWKWQMVHFIEQNTKYFESYNKSLQLYWTLAPS